MPHGGFNSAHFIQVKVGGTSTKEAYVNKLMIPNKQDKVVQKQD